MKQPNQSVHDAPRELAPGTITRLARQTKNQRRVSVYLDGAFAFGLYEDVVLQLGLRKGVDLSVAQQQEALSADERLRARQKAMDLLAYRARSSFELRRKLARAGFSDDAIADATSRLQELDLIDDRAFATQYAESRFRAKGYGPMRIAAELRARGIDRTLIDDVIAAQFSVDDAEVDAARAFAETRMARLSHEPDAARRRKKLYDALVRRGHSSDVIRRVLDEFRG